MFLLPSPKFAASAKKKHIEITAFVWVHLVGAAAAPPMRTSEAAPPPSAPPTTLMVIESGARLAGAHVRLPACAEADAEGTSRRDELDELEEDGPSRENRGEKVTIVSFRYLAKRKDFLDEERLKS